MQNFSNKIFLLTLLIIALDSTNSVQFEIIREPIIPSIQSPQEMEARRAGIAHELEIKHGIHNPYGKITEDDFNKPVPHLSNRILRDHVAAGVTYELQIVQEMNDPNLEFPHKKDSLGEELLPMKINKNKYETNMVQNLDFRVSKSTIN